MKWHLNPDNRFAMKPRWYKGYWIVEQFYTPSGNAPVLPYYRVKNHPDDNYSIHHGSFNTIEQAKKFIDKLRKDNKVTNIEFNSGTLAL